MKESDAHSSALDRELRRLLPWERAFAVGRLQRWNRQQQEANPSESPKDVRRKALKLTYTNVAGLWLNLAVIPTLAAAGLWSFHDSRATVTAALVLTVLVGIMLVFLAVRMTQANKYWPQRIAVSRRDLQLKPSQPHPDGEGHSANKRDSS